MPRPHPDPLHAFQAALEKRGYAADAVDRRLQMARRILAALDPADTSDRGYRQAVDRVVDSLSDPASAARYKQVARDFFPCFVEAGRHIPVTPDATLARPEEIPVALPRHDGLDDLIRQALAMKTTPAETRALESYATLLKRESADRRTRASPGHRPAPAARLARPQAGRPPLPGPDRTAAAPVHPRRDPLLLPGRGTRLPSLRHPPLARALSGAGPHSRAKSDVPWASIASSSACRTSRC